ncbi:hypothetical protein AA313_de0203775 [Arthrobotrys entomopaga]|nr:hypothetical protein AA313_de0203775 [Arthrobotrys entomopaga]
MPHCIILPSRSYDQLRPCCFDLNGMNAARHRAGHPWWKSASASVHVQLDETTGRPSGRYNGDRKIIISKAPPPQSTSAFWSRYTRALQNRRCHCFTREEV